jgi:hypothetical protein
MTQPSIVAEYVDTLTRELSFDIGLANRVRQEVEDHLWESAGNTSPEEQRRAIAMFGCPHEIAAQYAALSVWRQTRRTITVILVAIALVFVSMKLRMSWYQLLHWGLSAHLQGVGSAGLVIARGGFLCALATAAIGWAYIASCQAPIRWHAAFRVQLRRGLLLCLLSVSTLMISVTAGCVLTGLRLFEARTLASTAAIPLMSVAVEFVLIIVLIAAIRRAVYRMAFATQLASRVD